MPEDTAPAGATASTELLVEMSGITKSYPDCLANDRIDLSLRRGGIHALLGENGAGKSTLVKILYGLLTRDAGEIRWQGRPVEITSPARARELGIAMVFQHFSLFDSLSVLENIALGMGEDADANLHQRIIDVSTRYGLPLEPGRSVYTLSVGERQRIEIVRCLLQSPRLLIMDEPTSVLTPAEVGELFVTLRRLADEGVAILYISHKLEEIRQLCDQATILRGGRQVATADPRQESARSLAALMMGDEIPLPAAREAKAGGETVLRLSGLSAAARDTHGIALRELHLSLRAGEIVGIAGVAGNGQDELLRVLSGEQSLGDDRMLEFHGKPVGLSDVGERRRLGICCVPEERLGHAAVPDMSLAENAFLTGHHRRPLGRFGLLSAAGSRQFAAQIIERFNVQCAGVHALAGSLSGGNLQKFIVGREILQQPRVLIVSQPTWGVDAGAAMTIHAALGSLADQGAAVLLISQDLDELMLNCERIGALCAGRLSAFHRTDEVTVQQVGLLMGGESLTGSPVEAVT